MHNVAFIAVAAVFALWLAASAVGQFGRKSRWLRASPLGWSLPEWRLFAPDPGDHDYHLVYRYRLASGDCSEFEEAHIYSRARFRSVWNPEARKQKMLRDTVRALGNSARRRAGEEPEAARAEIARLASYRLLLGAVTASCAPQAWGIQFVVLRETPAKSLDLYFASFWHQLPMEGVLLACRSWFTSGTTRQAPGGSSWCSGISPPQPGCASRASATPRGSATTCRRSRTLAG
jgi:hypothetical protein